MKNLTDLARNAADTALSKKSDKAIKKMVLEAKSYVEAAINDPHTGWCRCERCEKITFFRE